MKEPEDPVVCTKVENHSNDIHVLKNPSVDAKSRDAWMMKQTISKRVLSVIQHGRLFSVVNDYLQTSEERDICSSGVKLYRKRFWILFLYALCMIMNGIHLMQYSVITHIITCYYDVKLSVVSWTTVVFMLVYIPLVFPVSWLMDRVGLRMTILLGSALNLLSTIIQCLSMDTNGFPIAMLSQTVSAISQVLLINVAPRLAAVWFGPTEVCRATALGLVAYQFGIAIGFLVPSLIMPPDCSDKSIIYDRRNIMAEAMTGSNMAILFLVITTFEKQPAKPPSAAEAAKTDIVHDYKQSIRSLLKNKYFVILCICFGIVNGVSLAQGTILDQLIAHYFPDSIDKTGWIAVSYIASGLVGAVVCGYILDYTQKFRESSIGLFMVSTIALAAFSFLLRLKILWMEILYLIAMGFAVSGFTAVSLEFAAEITYPEPESTSSSLLNAFQNIFGIILTVAGSTLIENLGPLSSSIFFTSAAVIGALLIFFVRCDLRRSLQENAQNHEDLPKA